MKLLNIYFESPGVRVDLKTKANSDVLAYVVFVRKWTSAGPLPEVTWFSETLETTGNSLVLGNEQGYDIILQALIRDGGHASIVPDLELSDPAGTSFTTPINLPQSEKPVVERGWKIVVQ
jgi:hypothetical protein